MAKKKTTKKTTPKKKKKSSELDFAGYFRNIPIYVDEDRPTMGWDLGVSDRTAFTTARRAGMNTAMREPMALTHREITEALLNLQRSMRPHDDTLVDEMIRQTGARSATEVLEVMLAMIQAFGINMKSGPGTLGEQRRLSMRLPLGRHTQTYNVMCNVSPDERESARMDRHYTYIEMFKKVLDPMTKWIDIAERAKKDMTFREILAIENIEQRRAALNIFGEERLLEESGARLLDTGTHDQELYVIPQDIGVFDTDAFYLKYNCPSTGRLYVSGVDPSLFINTRFRFRPDDWPMPPAHLRQGGWLGKDHTGWADRAMAWKFHMTPEEYASMSPHNQA